MVSNSSKESRLDKISNENIMMHHYHLKPMVTEGLNHYFDTDAKEKDDQSKSTASLTFKVRYRAITEYMEEKKHLDSYGFEEMSNKAFPYIKSLYEIFKVIHLD
jgi:hypothetical protein